MKKSMTFVLGTLMVAGVLAGATTSATPAKKANTIQPVFHSGLSPLPLCPSCVGQGGNNSGN